MLAAHAALAMAAARTEAALLTALDSREMIGQAKGILMERYKITGVQAFGLLDWGFVQVDGSVRGWESMITEPAGPHCVRGRVTCGPGAMLPA